MIKKELFDNYNGQDVYLYTLCGDGLEVGITDFGATVQFIRLQTENGIKDIALGYSTIKDLLDSGSYCGATIGRVANRIRNSRFTLNGKVYNLPNNEGKNCNHSADGFHARLFQGEIKDNVLVLTLLSPDGDQGFPGELLLRVEYEVSGKSLEVRYTAVSNKDTAWAPTCHIYFNLKGEDGGNIKDMMLNINADRITLLDEEHIPTGETMLVAGTPFDFTAPKPIGRDIDKQHIQLEQAKGYDHNYVLSGEYAATAYCEESGIKLSLYTDLPGVQLYTGNYLKGKGKTCEYNVRDGFCLEPQYFPNAVNTEKFLSPILKANQARSHYIRYDFDPLVR